MHVSFLLIRHHSRKLFSWQACRKCKYGRCAQQSDRLSCWLGGHDNSLPVRLSHWVMLVQPMLHPWVMNYGTWVVTTNLSFSSSSLHFPSSLAQDHALMRVCISLSRQINVSVGKYLTHNILDRSRGFGIDMTRPYREGLSHVIRLLSIFNTCGGAYPCPDGAGEPPKWWLSLTSLGKGGHLNHHAVLGGEKGTEPDVDCNCMTSANDNPEPFGSELGLESSPDHTREDVLTTARS